MVLKGVIRVLTGFFAGIGIQVIIHRVRYGLTVSVHSSLPCVVPHAQVSTLFLIDYDLRNLMAGILRQFKGHV